MLQQSVWSLQFVELRDASRMKLVCFLWALVTLSLAKPSWGEEVEWEDTGNRMDFGDARMKPQFESMDSFRKGLAGFGVDLDESKDADKAQARMDWPDPTDYKGPLIWDYTYENAKKLSDGIPFEYQLWLLLARDSGDYEKYIPIAEEVGREFYGKIIFVTVDVDDESNEDPLKSVQVRRKESPTMRLVRIYGDLMDLYKPDNPELTKGNMRSFVQGFFDGVLKAEPMSEMLPEDWDQDVVKVLTRENFDQFVNDRSKDVVVLFYAPWCKACQEIHPVYKHLAETFQNNKSLVLAKIDTTKNEIDTPISYLPTIKLFRREDNLVIMFDGYHERSYKRMVAFIKSRGEWGSVGGVEQPQIADEGLPVPKEEENHSDQDL